MSKIKILYLTNTSRLSGAEKIIYDLATGLNKEDYEIKVCTIKDNLKDQLLDKLDKRNIKTDCLELNKKWKVWKIFKLFSIIKNFKPDIIHTHLFHADLLGRLFNLVNLNKSIIISTNHSTDIGGALREKILKITDFLNFKTIAVSKQVVKYNQKITFTSKTELIYNGVGFKNFNLYQKNKKIKQELGFSKKDIIFLKTFKKFVYKMPKLHNFNKQSYGVVNKIRYDFRKV